ncbi:acyl carrier protein [Rhodonellum sp.]|uniref:acyl carrier protein n=1 Tax=Rhodonellum sp. TaxID=2231180 RepID=UPI0027226DCA|nr:acyl carrier protein [Rhodonellum sp.]MDO9551559.1 acyl carrier protein [Rhodonellum sp.]
MESKFINLVKEALEIEERSLEMSDHFKDFDEWDSLSQLTLIAELDDQFGAVIRMNDFKEINTLQELFDWIKNHPA